jgi:hypothetical protein
MSDMSGRKDAKTGLISAFVQLYILADSQRCDQRHRIDDYLPGLYQPRVHIEKLEVSDCSQPFRLWLGSYSTTYGKVLGHYISPSICLLGPLVVIIVPSAFFVSTLSAV